MSDLISRQRPAESIDFSSAVRDILDEHCKAKHAVTGADIEPLVEQITAAYGPRLGHERGIVARLRQQVLHLVAREKTLSHHMEQVHDSHVKTMVSRDRYGTQARVQAGTLSEISNLLRTAREDGSTMVSVSEVAAVLDRPRMVLPQHPPTPLSVVAADARWTLGQFERTDGQKVAFPLIGWAVIARGALMDSVIEPVFRADGRQVCQTDLMEQGLRLDALL